MVDRTVSVDITLQTSTAPTASFHAMFLTDDDTVVPVDRRFLSTTKSSYTSDLPASTEALGAATAFWSQSRTAQRLDIGRWVRTASNPYYVTGTTSSMTLATWVAVTDGTFTVQDNAGTPNEDDLTGLDFSSATTVAQVATVIETAIQAIAVPNITGLDTATVEFDNFGRLRLIHSATGAAAATLTIVSEGTGTDLTTSTFLDIATGVIVAGLDAEEPTAAVTAIREINDEWYKMSLRNESAVQQQALAAQFEALKKQLVLVTAVAADKDPASTTDVPYLLKALNYANTSIIYTENDITAVGGWVDMTTDGTVLPATEGSVAWSMQSLSATFLSGVDAFSSPKRLTVSETLALKNKNCSYIETGGGVTFMTPGLQCSGDQTNWILGQHWLEDAIQVDVFNYMIAQDIPGFNDQTLTAIEGYVKSNLQEALARGIIVDTPERPITIVFPVADDFTTTERASHTMELDSVFSAYLNSVANKVEITGELRI